jgi:hypothetical protein
VVVSLLQELEVVRGDDLSRYPFLFLIPIRVSSVGRTSTYEQDRSDIQSLISASVYSIMAEANLTPTSKVLLSHHTRTTYDSISDKMDNKDIEYLDILTITTKPLT